MPKPKCANGEEYVGGWKENKQHGLGTYKFANGDTHNGEWKDDKTHGLGTYKYASNGNEYSGYWEHDERCGKFLWLPTSKIEDPEREILENERECSICLEDFRQGEKRTSLPCKRGFHTGCVNTWFPTKSSCPVCRRCVLIDDELRLPLNIICYGREQICFPSSTVQITIY
jgi:hypothetical protein